MPIDFYRWDNIATNTLLYPKLLHSPPPHSHSIVLSDGSALIFQRNFFLRTKKNRLPDPPKICALDFKREFAPFAISSVSATIGIDWSIFGSPPARTAASRLSVKRPSAPTATTFKSIVIG
jgi:hypothetical protein